jgi:hypothetical protein
MIEQDTVKLLRECDAGVKMGIASIDDVIASVNSNELKDLLIKCRAEHAKLDEDLGALLNKYKDDGKDPNPIAKGMSWMKTNVMLAMDGPDKDDTIADLMTDGCNMGVKSLSQYLNKYKAADEVSKDIAKKLIAIEAKLAEDIRGYL